VHRNAGPLKVCGLRPKGLIGLCVDLALVLQSTSAQGYSPIKNWGCLVAYAIRHGCVVLPVIGYAHCIGAGIRTICAGGFCSCHISVTTITENYHMHDLCKTKDILCLPMFVLFSHFTP